MIRLLALPLLVGCLTDVELAQDMDGDGLLDPDEVANGSDPTLADTDGDSFGDAEEVAGNTDPTDPNDKPYINGWPIDGCRNETEGEGYAVGDVAMDFEVQDQFEGETVRLHDFCDQVVYIEFAAPT